MHVIFGHNVSCKSIYYKWITFGGGVFRWSDNMSSRFGPFGGLKELVA